MFGSFHMQIPVTVVGLGSINSIGNLVKDFGVMKVLIITDTGIEAGQIDKVKLPLEKIGCKFDIFDGCKPNSPTSVIEKCSQKVAAGAYDLLIGVGGGSVLDTTKIVSIVAPSGMKTQELFDTFVTKIGKRILPKILVPTTSGTGSEWSWVAVVTDETDGRKKVVRGSAAFADAAIVDPEMTLGLPQKITADTGMDALTHAIEAYISPRANIVGDMFAETAIKLISDNLRLAYAKGSNMGARYSLSVAASLAMEAVMLQGAGLAHLIDGFIVAKAHISHGEAVSILLPHVMTFNSLAVPKRFARIAELMGGKTEGLSVLDAARKSIEAVRELSQAVGVRQKLSDVGITTADIAQIVDDVFRFVGPMIEANNPRNASRDEVWQILNATL